MLSWLPFVGIVVGLGAVTVWLLRSAKRWQHPPNRDPEAMQAEARLWSTRIGDQR